MADREIEAMMAVSSAFDDLTDDERGRVLRWAADKYGLTTPLHSIPSISNSQELENENGIPEDGDEQPYIEDTSPSYEHFAELYAAASPKTKLERVMVAGYWLQGIEGKSSFQAFELNKELKHLGHYVDHIADTLTSGIKRKPQLILQLRKAGNKAQSRKTYKLSMEGIKVVEDLLS